MTSSTTRMSKTRTAVRAVSSLSAGISWIVPKSAGKRDPERRGQALDRTPGAAGVDRSGSWIPSGISPIVCSSVSAAPTTGNTSTVT